jgi:uncharacterized membrane protein
VKNPIAIRRYIVAGVLVWVPIWVTLLVLRFMVDLFDTTLELIPAQYQPEHLIGFHIPGLGLIFALIIVALTGMAITNMLGNQLVEMWEYLLSRIPLVRSIYQAVKQILTTLFSSSEDSFRNVLLVEYPRKGLWSIAFQTSAGFSYTDELIGDDMLTVFIPTTPNPTSGFLIIVPRKDTLKVNLGVDEALKMVISLGVVMPQGKEKITAIDGSSLVK